jgi:hypothetical protein
VLKPTFRRLWRLPGPANGRPDLQGTGDWPAEGFKSLKSHLIPIIMNIAALKQIEDLKQQLNILTDKYEEKKEHIQKDCFGEMKRAFSDHFNQTPGFSIFPSKKNVVNATYKGLTVTFELSPNKTEEDAVISFNSRITADPFSAEPIQIKTILLNLEAPKPLADENVMGLSPEEREIQRLKETLEHCQRVVCFKAKSTFMHQVAEDNPKGGENEFSSFSSLLQKYLH